MASGWSFGPILLRSSSPMLTCCTYQRWFGSILLTLTFTHFQKIKARLEEKELVFSEIVKLGNTMLEDMDEQTEPEQFMDDKLSTLEQRWSDLVSQETGSLDVRETAVKLVRELLCVHVHTCTCIMP